MSALNAGNKLASLIKALKQPLANFDFIASSRLTEC